MNDPFKNHKEPDEVFLPLTDTEYAEFYTLEMEKFSKDISFYRKHCRKQSRILECGCGEGRISRALAASGHSVVGLDLSFPMVVKAAAHAGKAPLLVCMDMTRMAFTCTFDHIIIPYNTLNLLLTKEAIRLCLCQIKTLLRPGGSLLLQVYSADAKSSKSVGKATFQFQIFPLAAQKGKIIKETLRRYSLQTNEMLLQERYRIRPTSGNGKKRDLEHTLHLADFTAEQWQSVLRDAKFNTISLYGDYECNPFQENSYGLLLIKASIN